MPIIHIFRSMALRSSAFGRTFSRSMTWCSSVTRIRQEVRSNNRNFPLPQFKIHEWEPAHTARRLFPQYKHCVLCSDPCGFGPPAEGDGSRNKRCPEEGKISQNISADKGFLLRGDVDGLVLFEHPPATSVPSAAHLGGTCRWPVPADQWDL